MKSSTYKKTLDKIIASTSTHPPINFHANVDVIKAFGASLL